MKCVVSKDDRVFAILMLCDISGCDIRRLTQGVYLMSLLGLDCNFRWSIKQTGVCSPSLEAYLEDIDYITASGGKILLKESGLEYINGFLLTDEEWCRVLRVVDIAETLSVEDLEFVVLVDMLITEVCTKYGVDNLSEKKGMIIKSLDTLTSVYSEENLNDAIKLLKEIGREWR